MQQCAATYSASPYFKTLDNVTSHVRSLKRIPRVAFTCSREEHSVGRASGRSRWAAANPHATWTHRQNDSRQRWKVWIMFSFQRRRTWTTQDTVKYKDSSATTEATFAVNDEGKRRRWCCFSVGQLTHRLTFASYSPLTLAHRHHHRWPASCASPCLRTMGNAATAKKGNEQESGEQSNTSGHI